QHRVVAGGVRLVHRDEGRADEREHAHRIGLERRGRRGRRRRSGGARRRGRRSRRGGVPCDESRCARERRRGEQAAPHHWSDTPPRAPTTPVLAPTPKLAPPTSSNFLSLCKRTVPPNDTALAPSKLP